jgi:hypothetical protein
LPLFRGQNPDAQRARSRAAGWKTLGLSVSISRHFAIFDN